MVSNNETEGAALGAAQGTGTLDLALQALEMLTRLDAPAPLSTLAAALGASKATLYRHLVTLRRHGYVRQEAVTGRYEIGVKLLVLGERTRGRFGIVAMAREALVALRDRTGQAVTLARAIDGDLVVLDLVAGRMVIEFGTPVGTRFDLHAGAHGKVWLAFGPPELMARCLAEPRAAWTPATITRPEPLVRAVGEVRRQGWAAGADEVIVGINALAAPVFDHRGDLAGSIAVVGATRALPDPPLRDQIDAVLETARSVSERLGGRQNA